MSGVSKMDLLKKIYPDEYKRVNKQYGHLLCNTTLIEMQTILVKNSQKFNSDKEWTNEIY